MFLFENDNLDKEILNFQESDHYDLRFYDPTEALKDSRSILLDFHNTHIHILRVLLLKFFL